MMKNKLYLKVFLGVFFLFSIGLIPVGYAANNIYAQNNDDGFSELSSPGSSPDSSVSSEEDWFGVEDSAAVDPAQSVDGNTAEEEESRDTVYPLIEIGGATILLYFVTWLLTQFNILRKSNHRKIWNAILLISFLVSGILGLVLVIQINYDVMGDWYSTFMWLHVDFGIVMALTSIFHILWHTKYFATLFRKRK